MIIYNPKTITDIKEITYSVSTTGDALFNSTIASTDSPYYSVDKEEANVQCVELSPLAIERVV